jgi:parallel beta-helix repeat protein
VINVGAIPSGSSGTKTTLRSEVNHGAILRPSGSGVRFAQFWEYNNQQWIVLDGFIFDGTNASAPVVGIDVRPNAGTDNLLLQNIELKQFAGWDSCAVTTALSGGGGPVSNVVFKNLDVHDIGYNQPSGSTCNCCYSYGIYLSGSGYTLDGNSFRNISGYGIHGYAGGGPGASSNTIRNNTFISTGVTGIFLCGGSNQIYNNVVKQAGSGGPSPGAPGIELANSCSGQSSSNNLITNNTVVSGSGQCVNMGSASNSIAQNNICYQNGPDAITGGGSGNTIDGTNLLGTDPQFVNAGGNDYHLQSGSPAAIGGTNLSASYTTDLEGATRPGSGAWTRGAYTVGGSSGPVTNLFVSVQPAGGLSNTNLATWTVQARDSNNNVVTGYTGNVSIAIGTNPGNAVPSGVLSKTFTAGVVSWDGLSLNKIGAGYTYVVTAATFSTTTAPFTITGVAPNAPTNVRATPIP